MRRIQVIIREIDDQTPEHTTDLATFDLPATNLAQLQPATALDQLETTTHTVGTQILQRVLQAQWDVVDATLAAQHRERLSPPAPSRRRPRTRERRQPLR
jgi:hypothetical protein